MTDIILLLFTAAFAVVAAYIDFVRIRDHKPIHHVREWIGRAVIVGSACAVFASIYTAIPCAFIFASIHRLVLNRKRGLDWRYVSESSIYDTVFILIAGKRSRAGTLAYCFEGIMVAGSVVYLSL